MATQKCQAARHANDDEYPDATNRVRFYCNRCRRGNDPDTQTDMNLCDECQVLMANMTMDCNARYQGCGYTGRGNEFLHPDGPPTERPPVFNGKEAK